MKSRERELKNQAQHQSQNYNYGGTKWENKKISEKKKQEGFSLRLV
jgi:hypothetical protein